jgi:transposase
MQHIAIDLGSAESQICIRSADGQILREGKQRNSTLKALFKKQPTSRVILETCAEAFAIADMALELGHEVRVVPATLVRSLGVGARGVKTDRRDAQVLSEVSTRIDLPSVHVPTDIARLRRNMTGMREQLVATRTQLVNCVRGWARTLMVTPGSGDVSTFPKRLRDAALKLQDGLPLYVDRLLISIQTLSEQLAAADDELETLAKEDPTCRKLMTVPGVGPVTSIRFVAALDDRTRFATAHAVQNYLGLTPGEKSSSQRQHRTGITKAGPAPVRRALVQAAWSLRRSRPLDPISVWAQEIENRRGKLIATVAVARKLAGILFAIWRDGSEYQAHHQAHQKAA